MAKSSLLESGEIIPVFYPVGKFDNDQRPRYVRAPFVILKLDNQEYIMPTFGPGNSQDLQNILGSSDSNLEQIMCRADFGFESDSKIVINESQLGDFNNPNSNWMSCFRIGFI